MPRLFGRLWRSGARRAEVAGGPQTDTPAAQIDPPAQTTNGEEVGRRLEEARARLRETIPPPEEVEEDTPQT